jgi:hypothetical protein
MPDVEQVWFLRYHVFGGIHGYILSPPRIAAAGEQWFADQGSRFFAYVLEK